MSARTLSLWLLALVIPILVILKPIQMFYEPGVEGGAMYRIGLGFLRRSDDPSLWSFIAAFAATVAVYFGTRSNELAANGRSVRARTSVLSWSITLLTYALAVLVYVANVRDHGGTFFWGANKGTLSPDQMIIEDLQDFEGIVSVIAMFIPYFFLGLVVQMVIDYFKDSSRAVPARAHLVALAGMLPLYAIAIYCLWYGAFLGLGAISPDAKEAIDTFRIQKLPAVLATQILFWSPLILICAGASYLWRSGIHWTFHEIGSFRVFPVPSAK